MNKLSIITAYTESFEEISELSFSTHKKYASIHNLHCQRYKLSNIDRPASWYKIPLILEQFTNNYEYVMWIDADALIINYSYNINDIINEEHSIYLCEDMNGFNCGVMIWKNTSFTQNILTQMWNMTQFINHIWWEQAAFIELYNTNIDLQRIVCKVPQYIMNAYDYSLYNSKLHHGQVNDNSLVFHLPGISNINRLNIMKKIMRV